MVFDSPNFCDGPSIATVSQKQLNTYLAHAWPTWVETWNPRGGNFHMQWVTAQPPDRAWEIVSENERLR